MLAAPVPHRALAFLGSPPLRAIWRGLWPMSVLGRPAVFFDRQPYRLLRRHHWAISGPVSSMVLMGRRRERARALGQIVLRRHQIGARAFHHLMPSPTPPAGLKAGLRAAYAQMIARAPHAEAGGPVRHTPAGGAG
jgi:hypothetical protein